MIDVTVTIDATTMYRNMVARAQDAHDERVHLATVQYAEDAMHATQATHDRVYTTWLVTRAMSWHQYQTEVAAAYADCFPS